VNIQRVERLILDNRRMTCHEIAQETNLSVGTDDEVKQAVLGWFSRTDKSFYAEAFQALVRRWDKCINVAGEYVEK
jgi:hypothetical protein